MWYDTTATLTLFHLAHEGVVLVTISITPIGPVVLSSIHLYTVFIVSSVGIRLTQIPFLILEWSVINPMESFVCPRKAICLYIEKCICNIFNHQLQVGALRQQAITWTMASRGHGELNFIKTNVVKIYGKVYYFNLSHMSLQLPQYAPAGLRHQDGCWCLSANHASGHQQPLGWRKGAHSLAWTISRIVNRALRPLKTVFDIGQ